MILNFLNIAFHEGLPQDVGQLHEKFNNTREVNSFKNNI